MMGTGSRCAWKVGCWALENISLEASDGCRFTVKQSTLAVWVRGLSGISTTDFVFAFSIEISDGMWIWQTLSQLEALVVESIVKYKRNLPAVGQTSTGGPARSALSLARG